MWGERERISMTTSIVWEQRISFLSLHMHLIHYGMRRRMGNHINQPTNQTERMADGLCCFRRNGMAVFAHGSLHLPRIVHVVVHLRRLPVGVHFNKHIQEGKELILAILQISSSNRKNGSFLLTKCNFEGVPKIRKFHARFIPARALRRGSEINLKLYSIVGE